MTPRCFSGQQHPEGVTRQNCICCQSALVSPLYYADPVPTVSLTFYREDRWGGMVEIPEPPEWADIRGLPSFSL